MKKGWLPAGFTFLEVIIILLILGIVAVLGLPMLSATLENSRLSGAANEILIALESAQFTASSSGRQTRVTIKAGNDSIVVEQFKISADLFNGGDELDENDVESGIFVPMVNLLNRGAYYSVSLRDEDRFRGVDITASDFDGIGNSVTFDVLGAPSKGGSVTLTLGDRQIVVALDSFTGKVTLSD